MKSLKKELQTNNKKDSLRWNKHAREALKESIAETLRAEKALYDSEPRPPAIINIVEPIIYRPTASDVEWRIEQKEDNLWTLTKTDSATFIKTQLPWTEFFRKSYKPGSIPVIGVIGTAPPLKLCDGWTNDACYHRLENGEYTSISASIINLEDQGHAKIHSIGFGDKYGMVNALNLYGLDILNYKGGRMALGGGNGPINELRIIDVAFGPDQESLDSGAYWGAGIKWGAHFSGDVRFLHWADQRHIDGVRFLEHCVYTHSVGDVYICRNNLLGGDRTGFQIRAHTVDSHGIPPHGEILVQDNFCDGFGMDAYDPTKPWQKGGGMVATVWTNPEHLTIIEGNKFTDMRYGGIGAIAAPTSWVNKRGFALERVVVRNNELSQAENRGDNRECMQLGGGIETLIMEGEMKITRTDTTVDMSINAEWPAVKGAPFNGENIIGNGILDDLVVGTFDPVTQNLREMTQEDKDKLYIG